VRVILEGKNIFRLDENIEKLGIMLKETPEDVSLLKAYADTNVLRGRFLEALQAYEKLISKEPATSSYYLPLANIFLMQSQPQDAVALFELADQQGAYGTEIYLLYKKLKGLGLINELNEWEVFKPDSEILAGLLESLDGGIRAYEDQIQDFNTLLEESNDSVSEYLLRKVNERKAALEDWKALVTQVLGTPKPAAVSKVKEISKAEPEEKYLDLQADLIPILEGFLNTKGVVGVCLADSSGAVVSQIFKEEATALKAPAAMEKFAGAADVLKGEHFNYWVLEYEHGLLMFKFLSERHLLLIIGVAGTNFGALRYIIEKSQELLVKVLS
jgi:tetratricopeptide (TPR) repeat protein